MGVGFLPWLLDQSKCVYAEDTRFSKAVTTVAKTICLWSSSMATKYLLVSTPVSLALQACKVCPSHGLVIVIVKS